MFANRSRRKYASRCANSSSMNVDASGEGDFASFDPADAGGLRSGSSIRVRSRGPAGCFPSSADGASVCTTAPWTPVSLIAEIPSNVASRRSKAASDAVGGGSVPDVRGRAARRRLLRFAGDSFFERRSFGFRIVEVEADLLVPERQLVLMKPRILRVERIERILGRGV